MLHTFYLLFLFFCGTDLFAELAPLKPTLAYEYLLIKAPF